VETPGELKHITNQRKEKPSGIAPVTASEEANGHPDAG